VGLTKNGAFFLELHLLKNALAGISSSLCLISSLLTPMIVSSLPIAPRREGIVREEVAGSLWGKPFVPSEEGTESTPTKTRGPRGIRGFSTENLLDGFGSSCTGGWEFSKDAGTEPEILVKLRPLRRVVLDCPGADQNLNCTVLLSRFGGELFTG